MLHFFFFQRPYFNFYFFLSNCHPLVSSISYRGFLCFILLVFLFCFSLSFHFYRSFTCTCAFCITRADFHRIVTSSNNKSIEQLRATYNVHTYTCACVCVCV
uniref:Uncharacterized protein n=1 Tax=Trypanosoma vivax (strain Y486) TaxID=1055687 RepID=G0TRG6_TRYVY|nr:hypothetical protein, unlikely [Trypanosoma vivax Y486]